MKTSRVDMAKKRISEAEDRLIEMSQTEMQREKNNEKQHPRTVGQFQNI